MGKFLKTCLMIGIICIVLGIALSSAGIFNGGLTKLKDEVLNGEWNIGKGEISPFFELEEPHYFENSQSVHLDVENFQSTFSDSEVHKLEVKSAGVCVNVTEHDGSQFIVDANNVYQFQVYEEEGILYIRARNKDIKAISGTVNIAIPTEVLDAKTLAVDVVSTASSIHLERLAASDVDMEVSAGTISWSDLTANDLSVEMAAGTVNGKNTSILYETSLNVNAGTITLQGVLGVETEVEMAAGLVEVTLEEDYTDYNYDVSCAGGSVTIDEQKAEGIAKTVKIDNNAQKNIDIECSMGAVNISFIK